MSGERKYCVDCGRWVLTIVPRHPFSVAVLRPCAKPLMSRPGRGGGLLCTRCGTKSTAQVAS